jgi:molecular chaperone GrpE
MEVKKDKVIYPKVVAGVFIFNEKNELFLAKSPKWHNKYICPGGRIELNEKIKDAAKREVKEETNLKITDIELVKVIDGLDIDKSYTKEDSHLIFLDHVAKVKGDLKIKLNEELKEYKWLPLDEWLKKKESKFGPYIIESLKRIKEFKEGQDFKNMYLRVVADYENLKKDTERQKQEWIRFANNNLINEILPVLDNFKVAVDHIPDNEKDSSWVVGITYIQNQLKKSLEDNGVEEIKTSGEKFDPGLHEAIDQETSKEELKKYKEGDIVKELRPGYKLHGKVIVPAKVVVKK